jgi:hypothetical protein
VQSVRKTEQLHQADAIKQLKNNFPLRLPRFQKRISMSRKLWQSRFTGALTSILQASATEKSIFGVSFAAV